MIKNMKQLVVGDVFTEEFNQITFTVTAVERGEKLTTITLVDEYGDESKLYFGPVCTETIEVR